MFYSLRNLQNQQKTKRTQQNKEFTHHTSVYAHEWRERDNCWNRDKYQNMSSNKDLAKFISKMAVTNLKHVFSLYLTLIISENE